MKRWLFVAGASALSWSTLVLAGPPDSSLDSDSYVEGGLPSYERAWSSADYETAGRVLGRLGKSNDTQLPRFESERSGAMFERMTLAENLQIVRNERLTLELRIAEALGLLSGSRDVFLAYLEPAARGVYFDRELVELTGFMLKLVVEAFALLDQLVPLVPSDAADRQARLEGLDQVRAGLSQMVAGAVTSLGERSVYGPASRVALAGHLLAVLPGFSTRLPDSQRIEIRVALAGLIEAEPDDKVRESLEALLAAGTSS